MNRRVIACIERERAIGSFGRVPLTERLVRRSTAVLRAWLVVSVAHDREPSSIACDIDLMRIKPAD